MTVSVKESPSRDCLQPSLSAPQAAVFEGLARFLLTGDDDVLRVGCGPTVGEEFAEGVGVGRGKVGEAAEDVGEVGGHVEVVQFRALHDRVQRGGGAAAGSISIGSPSVCLLRT